MMHILTARLVTGAKTLWNYNSIFEYTDRQVAVNTTKPTNATNYFTEFGKEMWDTYRGGGTPTFTRAFVITAGDLLIVNFSEACTPGAGGGNGMTVTASGGAVTLTFVYGTAAYGYIYSTSRTILSTETLSALAYTQPGTGIQATQGSANLASFSGGAVTNYSTATSGGGGGGSTPGYKRIGRIIKLYGLAS